MPKYWHDHIHLSSPEPAKTAEFYERMFAARVVSTRQQSDGRTTYVELDLNGSIILISPSAQPESAPAPSGTGRGLGHFGLRTDNIEAAVADLKAKGAEFTVEIREMPSGLKIAFLLAPENVLIELVERND